MQNVLLFLIIGLFFGILFLNIYFRVKVLKAYKYLVQNRVEFKTAHIFDSKRMEKEVLEHYPQHRAAILQFVDYIRFSVRVASILIFLITGFAAVLMFLN